MTLDEAIEHAKQVARTCEDDQCAAEHMQLAEWLRQARGSEAAGRWYTTKVRELQSENAKLRELCRRALVVLENNCSRCVYFYECDILNDCNCAAPMHIRDELRELGVEVDDG